MVILDEGDKSSLQNSREPRRYKLWAPLGKILIARHFRGRSIKAVMDCFKALIGFEYAR